ncbi:MAG: hypothetical protein H7Z72_25675 [Bacteroidetes bacterium]|nr:hypothetical protein [Fibrella sp.]
MTLTPFENQLYSQLSDFFARQQYALLPAKKQFRKVTPTGFQNVVLSPSYYGIETWLDVTFGCRNDQVEQIAQQFLHNLTDFRPDANTIIISVGKFTDQSYFRYKIGSPDQMGLVCDEIKAFFDADGFAFLDQAGALSTLDQVFNQFPHQPSRYVYNQTHRCYKGLIAARLNHNPHFEGLTDSYRHGLLRQTQNPYEQLNFERLVTYLQHYSAN